MWAVWNVYGFIFSLSPSTLYLLLDANMSNTLKYFHIKKKNWKASSLLLYYHQVNRAVSAFSPCLQPPFLTILKSQHVLSTGESQHHHPDTAYLPKLLSPLQPNHFTRNLSCLLEIYSPVVLKNSPLSNIPKTHWVRTGGYKIVYTPWFHLYKPMGAISYSRASSWLRGWTFIKYIPLAGRFFMTSTTREAYTELYAHVFSTNPQHRCLNGSCPRYF